MCFVSLWACDGVHERDEVDTNEESMCDDWYEDVVRDMCVGFKCIRPHNPDPNSGLNRNPNCNSKYNADPKAQL